MARGKAISDEVRAKVIAELLTGEGVNEVSRRLELPKATVSRIKNEVAPEKLEQVGTETAARMESMIAGYVAQNFAAMKAICEVASDANYLKQQDADKIAELHAELATRAFQLLEAESISEAETEAD